VSSTHDRRPRVGVVRLEIRTVVHVHVPRQHDRVWCACLLEPRVQPIARCGVAVPFVHRETPVGVRGLGVPHVGWHLLAQHGPDAAGLRQIPEEPGFLLRSKNGPAWIERFRAMALVATAARGPGPPLSCVEYVQVDERAELQRRTAACAAQTARCWREAASTRSTPGRPRPGARGRSPAAFPARRDRPRSRCPPRGRPTSR
jgi:hypothetical protein